jgi:hypothetical protein
MGWQPQVPKELLDDGRFQDPGADLELNRPTGQCTVVALGSESDEATRIRPP